MNFTSLESHTISILHVEDSDADAKLVELYLRQSSHDYELHRTISANEALSFLRTTSVDLILLDLFLPDSQGLDTLKHLRSHFQRNAIVVITGSNDEGTALMAVQNGAQDYLVKDELTPRVIARAIRYSIERHKYDQHVIELASVDMLTGLPNRARFISHLDEAIKNTQRLHYNLSLLFIDCDHFKLINDTLGHVKGDEFLVQLSMSLKSVLRSSDFAARLAGDEFVVALQTRNGAMRSPLVVAEKILAIVRNGIKLSSGETLDARCSIGVTSFSGVGETPSTDKMIHEADTAMYSSKKRGGDCVSFFDVELEKKAERRLSLLRDMAHAVHNQEFYLNYQPIVDSRSGLYTGLEALLRWRNRRGEIISPEEFITLLEENGLIHPIGRWIVKQACTDFLSLVEQGLLGRDAWLSVNISPIQLQDKSFLDDLKNLIHDMNIRPSSLHLEITESLLMEKSEYMLALLNDVRSLGCKWSIDDFGVGYSSMSYLKNLPIDTLKIDKSFILHCCDNDEDLAITKAMISLAHNLNMDVVAEGVESDDVAQLLAVQQCDFLQGYHFSRPVCIDELESFLRENRPSFVGNVKL